MRTKLFEVTPLLLPKAAFFLFRSHYTFRTARLAFTPNAFNVKSVCEGLFVEPGGILTP